MSTLACPEYTPGLIRNNVEAVPGSGVRFLGSHSVQTNLTSRSLVLEMCAGLSLRVPGNIIEFGVAHGGPTRVIREALSRFSNASEDEDFRHKQIFAHDSGGIFGNLPTLQLRIG